MTVTHCSSSLYIPGSVRGSSSGASTRTAPCKENTELAALGATLTLASLARVYNNIKYSIFLKMIFAFKTYILFPQTESHLRKYSMAAVLLLPGLDRSLS